MRQRNIKNLDAKIAEVSSRLIDSPEELKGKWREHFGFDGTLEFEIGCGKGKFITEKAAANPQNMYIAVEGQLNVLLRGLQKAEAADLSNIAFFCKYVDNLNDIFEKGELDTIYLNFSDPWPKDRHYKRRLTYRERLETYFDVLKPGGAIEFKTDNDGLFEFSMEEIKAMGYEILEYSEDLHASEYESRLTTTEYEDRFSGIGKNIWYVKFRRTDK